MNDRPKKAVLTRKKISIIPNINESLDKNQLSDKNKKDKSLENYNRILSYFNDSQNEKLEINPYDHFQKSSKGKTLVHLKKKVLEIQKINSGSNTERNIQNSNYLNQEKIKMQPLLTTRTKFHDDQSSIKKKNPFVSFSSTNYVESMENNSDSNHKKLKLHPQTTYISTTKDKEKINELVNLLNNRRKDLSLIQMTLDFIHKYFPDLYDNLKPYVLFEYNQESEIKQIEGFLNILNIIIQEFKPNNLNNEIALKCKELIKILYFDYINNLNRYSKKRAEFFDKIWNFQCSIYQRLGEFDELNLQEIKKNLKTTESELKRLIHSKNLVEIKFQKLNDTHKKLVHDYNNTLEKLKEKDETIEKLEKTINEKMEIIDNIYIPLKSKKSGIINYKDESKQRIQTKIDMDIKNLIQSRENRISPNKPIHQRQFKIEVETFQKDSVPIEIVEDSNLNKNTIRKRSFSKRAIKSYANKGVDKNSFNKFQNKETQTEVNSLHLNIIDSNNYLDAMNIRNSNFQKNLDIIKKITTQFIQTDDDIDIHSLNSKDDDFCPTSFVRREPKFQSLIQNNKARKSLQKKLISEVHKEKKSLNANKLKTLMDTLLFDCNLILKDNDTLREKIDNEKDKNENLKESYAEAINLLHNNIIDNTNDIANLIEQNNTLPNNLKITLNNIVERNIETYEKEKNTLNVELKIFDDTSIKKMKIMRANEIKSAPVLIEKQKSIDHLNEFKTQHLMKIKSVMPIKKVAKIIEIIFFDFIERYFKKEDKLQFEFEENFIDPSELPYLYFEKNFGLESLSKSKYFEFLNSCFNHRHSSPIVPIFCNFIHLNMVEKDKNWDFYERYNFITVIQNIKLRNSIIKIPSEEMKIYIIYSKLQEIVIENFGQISNHITKAYQSFFDVSKKTIIKEFKSYTVIDFDDFIIFIDEIIVLKKRIFMNNMRIIFNSLDIENLDKIFFQELEAINHYIFKDKIRNFRIFQKDYHKDSLNFDEFILLITANNAFSISDYNEFLKETNKETLQNLMDTCYHDICGSDKLIKTIFKRIDNFVSNKHNLDIKRKMGILNEKLKNPKKIEEFDPSQIDEKHYTEIKTLWTSFRIFDTLTLEIYNETKIHSYVNEITIIMENFNHMFNIQEKNYINCFLVETEDNIENNS